MGSPRPSSAEDLLELEGFAVKARDSPDNTPLPASREHLLGQIRHLREEFERQIPMRCPLAQRFHDRCREGG